MQNSDSVLSLNLQRQEIKSIDSTSLQEARLRLEGELSRNPEMVAVEGEQWLKSILDEDTYNASVNFRNSSHDALLISGFPVTTTVETPPSGFLSEEECVLDFDLLHLGMLKLMGIDPFSVEFENSGKLIRNVVPVSSAAGTTSSWGADVEFFWHTDNPNWPFASSLSKKSTACSPEFLAFVAVRNHEMASTDVVSVSSVISELPDQVIDSLKRKAYKFGFPASNDSESTASRIFPIIEEDVHGPMLRFDDGIIEATDEESERALGLFREVLSNVDGAQLVLQPGDFFIFKNPRVLHRRKAFTPHSTGNCRWLRRCYGV